MEKKKSKEVVDIYHKNKDKNKENINSDVLGSYTGNPYKWERPDQDADDI